MKLPVNTQVKKNLCLILISGVLWWAGATYGRQTFIQFKCTPTTIECTKAHVPRVDRWSVGLEDGKADQYSFLTQNLSGVLAISAPAVLTITSIVSGISPLAALGLAFTEWSILAQTITWNGVFTEISHFIGQRPRPFVFKDPLNLGVDPAHFTSFYSGHTSFSAACLTAIFFMLIAHREPYWLCFTWAALSQGLILSTAYFRILAGRHFLTDVVCGAAAGMIVASVMAYLYRFREPLANR